MPLIWSLCPFVEIVELIAVPEPALDPEVGQVAVDGERVRRIRLQFDGISAAFAGTVDGGQCAFERAVVICGQLGDDVWWLISADFAIVNHDLHGCIPAWRTLLLIIELIYFASRQNSRQ